MALQKVDYVNQVTVITAENMNAIQDAIIALEETPAQGLTEDMKQALLQIARKVAYIDDQGQTYYDDLYDAFYPPKTVVLITAVFEQGSTVIYDDTALDDLKQYLTVTAKYDDNTTAILADSAYTLSGLLEAGTSTVTVAYNGLTTTFTVNVTARPTLSSISAVYTNESANVPLSSIPRSYSYFAADFTWKTANDSYAFVIPVTVGKAYRLHLTTTDSTVVGTIFRWAFCDTNTPSGQLLSACNRSFSPQAMPDVTVKAVDSYMLIQVASAFGDAIATNGYLEITEYANSVFDTGSLDVLKQNLVVTANYSDGSSVAIDDEDYELSGNMNIGLNTITVSYGGKTDTFEAVVTAPLYIIPDFSAQTASGQTVTKSNGVYTLTGTGTGVVYIAPNGTVSASKSSATWFATTGGSLLNSVFVSSWQNPNASESKLEVKWSRSSGGNLASAQLTMAANGSGTDASIEYKSSAYPVYDFTCLAMNFSTSGSTSASRSAEFEIMLIMDGVRYL